LLILSFNSVTSCQNWWCSHVASLLVWKRHWILETSALNSSSPEWLMDSATGREHRSDARVWQPLMGKGHCLPPCLSSPHTTALPCHPLPKPLSRCNASGHSQLSASEKRNPARKFILHLCLKVSRSSQII
jgi:hypothetical protein